MQLALRVIADAARGGMTKAEVRHHVQSIVSNPGAHTDHPALGELARALVEERAKPAPPPLVAREGGAAPWRQWGVDLEPDSIQQMINACELPVSVAGALMPDAHVGYGLPIGGVLATHN